MKKLLGIAALALAFTGCTLSNDTKVGDIGVPSKVSHIEFWNGGQMMRSYDNAKVVLKIESTKHSGIIGPEVRVTFYTYEVTANGKTEKIIDSETMAIIYTE